MLRVLFVKLPRFHYIHLSTFSANNQEYKCSKILAVSLFVDCFLMLTFYSCTKYAALGFRLVGRCYLGLMNTGDFFGASTIPMAITLTKIFSPQKEGRYYFVLLLM